jgi:hypothetical protein
MFNRDFPKKTAKTAVCKALNICLNFKLFELNRLIVLHKSVQNKCYFNIVANILPENMRNWQKSGHEKVSITGTCLVFMICCFILYLRIEVT